MFEELHAEDYDIKKCKLSNRLIVRKNKFSHYFNQGYPLFFSILLLIFGFAVLLHMIRYLVPNYTSSLTLVIPSFIFGLFSLIWLVLSIRGSQRLTRLRGAGLAELNRKCSTNAAKKLGWMILRNNKNYMTLLADDGAYWLIIIYDEKDILVTCNSGNMRSIGTLPISAKVRKEKLKQFYGLFCENMNQQDLAW